MSYYIAGRQRRLRSPQFGQGTRRVVRLPVSTMKIDRSLVSDITSDPRSRVLIEAALWIADRLEIRCVAEGIETQEQLDLLREIGCTEFQGWLFGRPLPADSFAERWLRPAP